MHRLFYPFRYFRLINDEKRHIDIWPTLIIAVIIAFPFYISDASFFRPNGFLDRILVLTSAITGFYVAALVAAATFSHPDLDKVISAGRIALITKDVDGRKISEALTRREFVCTLFGYLSFSAFIISVLSAYLIGISSASTTMLTHLPIIGIVFTKQYFLWVRLPMIGGMSLLVAHLVTATALGIYYLMDRLYRYDRKIITPKSGTSGDASAAA